MKQDNLFKKKENTVSTFDFGKEIAEVFDDMLERSVPLYEELQRMIGEIAFRFAVDNTAIYDLGCSTGRTLRTLFSAVTANVKFIGVDYSLAMLGKCKEHITQCHPTREYELICADLNNEYTFKDASVIILTLTLQFVRPERRETLIQEIYAGLCENGCLVLVEKVTGNNAFFTDIFTTFYYAMKKRNGYSTSEIARKKEALEKVLVPYSLDENKNLLVKNGFTRQDVFFKWHNFCGFIAVKEKMAGRGITV